jgi:hypothetical protein
MSPYPVVDGEMLSDLSILVNAQGANFSGHVRSGDGGPREDRTLIVECCAYLDLES